MELLYQPPPPRQGQGNVAEFVVKKIVKIWRMGRSAVKQSSGCDMTIIHHKLTAEWRPPGDLHKETKTSKLGG